MTKQDSWNQIWRYPLIATAILAAIAGLWDNVYQGYSYYLDTIALEDLSEFEPGTAVRSYVVLAGKTLIHLGLCATAVTIATRQFVRAAAAARYKVFGVSVAFMAGAFATGYISLVCYDFGHGGKFAVIDWMAAPSIVMNVALSGCAAAGAILAGVAALRSRIARSDTVAT